VRFVHFSELKRDLPGTIRQIAEFLQIRINESRWTAILGHCSFESMKKNATKNVPLGGLFRDAGAGIFINKGVNGRWADVLTPDEAAGYERIAIEQLGAECAP
jgi:aryl sulfotransferase